MAKVKTGVPELTIDLVGPGMTYLHRAGLGGLACTLRKLKDEADAGRLKPAELPGGPWDGDPPWQIEPRRVTLLFGEPTAAREYLRRLFAFAFRLTPEGLIDLPGQYPGHVPPEVRSELQSGMILTFLQHGKSRDLTKTPTLTTYDPEGEGRHQVEIEYKQCTWYKHQDGWEALTEENGTLAAGPFELDGAIQPGAVVRHNAFNSHTKAEDTPARMLAGYFALVGCLALPVNRGCAVLLVPELEDLEHFVAARPAMTPTKAEQCRITSAGDAALQAQARLHAQGLNCTNELPGCLALLFRPTKWATQQKFRVAGVHVPALEDARLELFELALTRLSRRLVVREGGTEAYWIESIVRPLVADNLATGRIWYAGFRDLCASRDDSGKSRWKKVCYESEGLNDMANDKTMLSDEGESVLVEAVHQAIRSNLGRIKAETKRNNQDPHKRWDRFKERLRLDLVGAKTLEQCRQVLCSLFGKAGWVPVLHEQWAAILPMLREDRWRAARDLALLGLASYRSKKPETTKTETTKETP